MRKARYAVARLSDLTPDVGAVVPIGDEGECALFLHGERVFAVGSLCPHQNASLANAPAEQGQAICRRHGYRFDLKTGNCTTIGGYGLPVYETQIENDTVWVSVWEYD